MDKNSIKKILENVSSKACSVEQALANLQILPLENTPSACIDHHRELRTGIPEVIYGESKSASQIIEIANAQKKQNVRIIATRVSLSKAKKVTKELGWLTYHKKARILTGNIPKKEPYKGKGYLVVASAGTSDMPVSMEASITAESMGHEVKRLNDIGVAGLHRMLIHQETLENASAIIAVAGMEGALPSVIAGLVSTPVIAVPTSVGYGANFGGISALLGMLNSCAPGVAVVNIDNGFGGACMAMAINMK